MSSLSFDPHLRSQMERNWPNAAVALLRAIHSLKWEIIEEDEYRSARRLRRPAKYFSNRRRIELEEQVYECWCVDTERCLILHRVESAIAKIRAHESLNSDEQHVLQHFASSVKDHAIAMLPAELRALGRADGLYVHLLNESSPSRANVRYEQEASTNWDDDRRLDVKARATQFYNAIEIQGILHSCCDARTGVKMTANPSAFRIEFRRETRMAHTVTWKPRILDLYIRHLAPGKRIVVLKEACASLQLNRDDGLVAMYVLGRLIESDKATTVVSARELLDFEGLTSLDQVERAWRYRNYERLLETVSRFCIHVGDPDSQPKLPSEDELFSISHKKVEECQAYNSGDLTHAPSHVTMAYELVPGNSLRMLRGNPKRSHPLMDMRTIGRSPKKQPSRDWMVSIFLACLSLSRIKCKEFSRDEPMRFHITRRTLLTKYPPNKSVQAVLNSDNAKRAPAYFSEATRTMPLSTFFEVCEEASKSVRIERLGNRVKVHLLRGWDLNDQWLDETIAVTVREGTALHAELAKVVRSRRKKPRDTSRKLT